MTTIRESKKSNSVLRPRFHAKKPTHPSAKMVTDRLNGNQYSDHKIMNLAFSYFAGAAGFGGCASTLSAIFTSSETIAAPEVMP